MRWGHVVVVYFLLGAMLWAGGIIAWSDAGVGQTVVDPTVNGTGVNESTQEELEGISGPLESVASSVEQTGLFVVAPFVFDLVAFVFWPITVLAVIDAPVQVQVVGGGGLVMAFVMSLVRFIRSG